MILLLSTSDTDLLSARASGADFRLANPARTTVDDLPELLADVDLVVVRILGGRRFWEEGLDALLAGARPVVVLGGEVAPDAELMRLSTVPAGVAADAHAYLAQGGAENLAQLHHFLSDTVLLTGIGFAPPVDTPVWGVLERQPRTTAGSMPTTAADGAERPAATRDGTSTDVRRRSGPVIGVLYYRAHHVAGNTAFVEALSSAIEDAGGQALPVFCASLRAAPAALLETLRQADALVDIESDE